MIAPDAISGFFLICFLVGLIFSVTSFLLGSLNVGGHHGGAHGHAGNGHGGHFGHAHAGDAGGAGHFGHGHAGHGAGHAFDGHGAGHAFGNQPAGGHMPGADQVDMPDTRGGSPSPVNLSTIMAFLVGFGGVGYIVHATWGAALVVAALAGAVAGLIGATIIFVFLTRVLLRYRAYLDASSSRLVGAVGHVTVPIPGAGVGEIVYPWRGARRSDGARSATGQPIPRLTEVTIVAYERGIALVEPFEEYVRRSSERPAPEPAAAKSGGE